MLRRWDNSRRGFHILTAQFLTRNFAFCNEVIRLWCLTQLVTVLAFCSRLKLRCACRMLWHEKTLPDIQNWPPSQGSRPPKSNGLFSIILNFEIKVTLKPLLLLMKVSPIITYDIWDLIRYFMLTPSLWRWYNFGSLFNVMRRNMSRYFLTYGKKSGWYWKQDNKSEINFGEKLLFYLFSEFFYINILSFE